MSNDALDLRRKRLVHRSRYRGFLESDILFQRFCERCLAKLDAGQLDRFEALLDESDHDVFGWVTGTRPVPARHDNDIVRMMRDEALVP